MRSNVYCTNCYRHFIAELDLDLDGNHEITCPLCQHVHYRVVRNGVVTEARYRSSAGPTIVVSTSTTVTLSSSWVIGSNTATGTFVTQAWLDRTDLNT